MKLIDGYILRTVIKATLLTLLVLTVLTFVLSLIEELDDVGKADYEFLDAFIVALSAVPRYIYQAFPLSALIGALLGMGGMANAGELNAMRAAGMTSGRILYAVLKAGVLLMLLVVLLGDVFGPPLERYGDQLRQHRLNKQVTFSSKHGFWAKDGRVFVNVHSLAPDGSLRNLLIYRFDENQELRQITAAGLGVQVDGGWLLRQVRQSIIEPDRINTRHYKELPWDRNIDPSVLSAASVSPYKLPVWDLYYQKRNLQARGQNAINYAVAFWNKFAVPLTTLGMLILALPMVMGSSRSVSAGQRIFMGILIGTVFFMINRGFGFTVIAMELPPVSIVFFPWLLFGLVYMAIREPLIES